MADEADNDFRIERKDSTVIVRLLAQELTMFHVPELRADVLSLVEEKPERMLFDFTRTSFIDSSAIALLFKVAKQIAASGGQMAVCGLRPGLLKVLRSVVREGGIEFFDTVDSAFAES